VEADSESSTKNNRESSPQILWRHCN
jgi:hypothetical protein